MYQLEFLSNEENNTGVRIIKEVQADWLTLTGHLRLQSSFVRSLQTYRDPHYCCWVVFNEWLKGDGREPKTWETVIQVLNEMEYTVFAKELCLVFTHP